MQMMCKEGERVVTKFVIDKHSHEITGGGGCNPEDRCYEGLG